MKKLFKSLFVVIAATATFAGCQKEENNAPAAQTKTVEFFANSIDTKTQFGTPENGVYPTLWTAGDEVTVLVNLDNVANTQKQTEVECSDDFKSARFEAELVQPNAESFTFYSVSPSSALKGKSSDKGYLYVEILAEQIPLETSVDKKAQVLYATSEATATMPSSVDLDFHHLTAYGKFSLVNLTDQVSSVSKIKIEAPEDVYIAGKWDYFVANGSFVVREGNGSNAITLTTTKTSDIWFAAAPAATSGKKIKFTVTTDKGDLVKEVTFPGDLVAGKIATFSVNMDGINPPTPEVTTAYYKKVTEAPSDWSGTYVLGYTNGTTVKVLSGKNSAGNYGAYTDLTLGENGISSTSVPENCVLTIESSVNGYTLFVNNTYLGYTLTATSSSNYLYFASSVTESKYEWTISLDGSNVLIKSVYNTGRTIKWNSKSPRFACYTSGQTAIQLYRLEEGSSEPEQPALTPRNLAYSSATATATVGQAFTAPTLSGVTTGVTYSSSNTAVATVNASGVVTHVGAGTTIITASAPKTDLYEADEASYTLTVSAAQGGGQEVMIYKESFGNNSSSARAWNDTYKEQSGISAVYSNATYTMTNLKQGKNTTGKVKSGINQSSTSSPAFFEVKNLNVSNYSNFKVSYYWNAGSIKGTYYTKLYYSTDGGITYKEVSKESGTGATSFVEVNYSLPQEVRTSSLCLKVEFSTSNTQAIIDEFELIATN